MKPEEIKDLLVIYLLYYELCKHLVLKYLFSVTIHAFKVLVKENVLKIIFNNLNIDIISNINLTSNNICLIFCCNLWWWSLSIGIIVSCSASQKTLQSVGGLKSNYITIYLTTFFFFLLLLLRWLIWVDLIIANTKMLCI